MTIPRRDAPVFAAVFAACVADPLAGGVATQADAVGEPQAGYPNWAERTVFVLTNRARADPSQALAECLGSCCPWREYSPACYPPVPPLAWDFNLARAARFHATFLGRGRCALSHPSCCALAPGWGASGCDGDPACACNAGTFGCGCGAGTVCIAQTTDPFVRIGGFGTSGCAENIAAGVADPVTVIHLWLDECTAQTTCNFTQANGHRWNILRGTNTKLGVGFFSPGGCFSSYTVQDFGCGAATLPRIVGGTHHPLTGSTATAFTFWANYFHAGGTTPTLTKVVVDGRCHDLALDVGTVSNGTFAARRTFATGCHSYYFLFQDSAGAAATYPSAGSLTLGVATACPAEYTTSQSPADCLGQTCTPAETPEVSCADGLDNDCDNVADCVDLDCSTRPCGSNGRVCLAGQCACTGGDSEVNCGDGLDNDCDGLSDCADPGCVGRSCGAGRSCLGGICAPIPPDSGPDAGADAGPDAAAASDASDGDADASAAKPDAGPEPSDGGSADAGLGRIVGVCGCGADDAAPAPALAVLLAWVRGARRRGAVGTC